MKKIILLFATLLAVFSVFSQSIINQGIVVFGGVGSISSHKKVGVDIWKVKDRYKLNGSIGYQLQIGESESPMFFETSINAGIKTFKSESFYYDPLTEEAEGLRPYKSSANDIYYFGSIGATVNYKIYKSLSIGTGFEPTYYNFGEKGFKGSFDIPVVGKVNYDFGKFQVGLAYKQGLYNAVKTQYSTGKFRDFVASVYIPF